VTKIFSRDVLEHFSRLPVNHLQEEIVKFLFFLICNLIPYKWFCCAR